MGILDRLHPNFEGNIRVDLPDFLLLQEQLIKDFQFLIQTYLDGSSARILYKYEQGTHLGLTFKVKADVRRAFQDGNQQWVFKAPGATGVTTDLLLPANSTRYIMARSAITKDNLQSRAFWNTDLGVSGEEYFDDINVNKYIEEEILALASVNPNYALLWTVTTGPAGISTVTDNQDLLW
jgi:hypothetical protein